MLVDDDALEHHKLKYTLNDSEIKLDIVSAYNGEEALDYLNAHKYNLPAIIILDLNMPKMNGIEFLEAIKPNEIWAQIPIVVLTTSKDQQDKLATFSKGISGYMVKPVDYPQFKEMIATIKDYWNLSEHPY